MYFSAFLTAPPVPRGSFSCTYLMFSPYFFPLPNCFSNSCDIYATQSTASFTPCFFNNLNWYSKNGRFTIGRSGLGILHVNGRSLVPRPPIRINAFMLFSVQTDNFLKYSIVPANPSLSVISGFQFKI